MMYFGHFRARAVSRTANGVSLAGLVLDELAVNKLVCAVLDETGHAQAVSILARKNHNFWTARKDTHVILL